MKSVNLLLTLLSTSTISGIINPPIEIEPDLIIPDIDSDEVLSNFTNKDQFLYLSFKDVLFPTYQFEMQFLDIETNEVVFDKVVKYNELSSGSYPKAYDFLMPFEQYFTNKGLKINLSHKLLHNQSLQTSAVIYPSKKEEVNVSGYRNNRYVREGDYLSVVDACLCSKEEFDFTDLNEYLAIGKSNKLDLSNIKFKYLCPHPFYSEDIYLTIRDFNNVFPQLKNSNNEIVLKMNYIQENDEISLVLDTKLYVNKETYEMSFEKGEKYIEVNTLFIQNGKEKYLMDDEAFISIKNAGYSETDFKIPFSFAFTNKYLGECYDSDYCITGGVKQ